ncbi:TRAM domain-containing protein [Jatrophihabitans sp.]|uniref:class I SAM-dependent RNA methyltransferase n=1 Tax=Jatrophihabitans sp. TaxID=1932789 RepID=UPI0030C6A79C|nr:putative methyltransferase [Jatrophihabitans sp.]
MAEAGPLLGEVLQLEIGPPGHGGFCVARHEGRVVFVRHTLPGELVLARVTEDAGGSYCRADAVEILRAAPERVEAPCPYAGPGRCGGCDWQHVSAEGQRALKLQVVHEQFRRFADLDISEQLAAVEELPGGLLGWRTRIAYAVDRAGAVGLRQHRSHRLELIEECLLGVPGVGDGAELGSEWPGLNGLELVASDAGTSVIAHRAGPSRPGRGRRAPDRLQVIAGAPELRHQVGERELVSAAAGFWQVHPAALETFTAAVLEALQLQPGERVLELYAGAGALTVALAGAVGSSGQVIGYESARQAVQDAASNLAALPWAEVRYGRVDAGLVSNLADYLLDNAEELPNVVVLDPPRTGAGPETTRALLALRPRAIAYVACDPVSLARDVGVAREAGWRLASLRAFDAFPMTHHVECVALLLPPDSP